MDSPSCKYHINHHKFVSVLYVFHPHCSATCKTALEQQSGVELKFILRVLNTDVCNVSSLCIFNSTLNFALVAHFQKIDTIRTDLG